MAALTESHRDLFIRIRNYPGMLIGRTIAILYFLARKITAEDAEERRAFNHLFPLRVPLRTLRLNSRFGYSIPHVPGSSCIVKSLDSGFRYLSSYTDSCKKRLNHECHEFKYGVCCACATTEQTTSDDQATLVILLRSFSRYLCMSPIQFTQTDLPPTTPPPKP